MIESAKTRTVVANTIGKFMDGRMVFAFPSRWDGAWRQGGRRPWAHYPYELAYLSTLLKRETDHDVMMIDGNFDCLDEEDYAEVLIDARPDFLITECSAMTLREMTRVCQRVRDATGARIAVAGPHITPEVAQKWDYAVQGEYEHKILAWIQGQEAPDWLLDVNWLPWPEDEDIFRINYFDPHTQRVFPGHIQVFGSRGCPLACTFCAVPTYYGGHGKSYASHRVRNVEDVCDEIQYLSDRYKEHFTGAFFNEETHNANSAWFTELCQALISRGLNRFSYDAMCGYWPFTEELVELANQAGYQHFRVGVETLADAAGKAIHKNVHEEKLREFLGWCKQCSIRVYGTFQIGTQGSTQESDRATMRTLQTWKDDGLMRYWQCSISTPQVGTPFYDHAKREGWLQTEDLSRYSGVDPVVSYPHYSASQILETWQSRPRCY